MFYLGSKAVDILLDNFSSNTYWKISSDSNRALFWAKNKLLFLLACLLHDIGHTPFSHSLENIILENSRENSRSFTQILIEKINCMESMGEKVDDLGKAAAHEKMGALMILELLRDNIKQIYQSLNEAKFPQEETGQLDNDICFIVRMILGLKYQGYEPEKQIRNCFIELLNGDNFDVDKLDYIIRDTKMSGISNIDIDTERLLGAVCVVIKSIFIDRNFDNELFSNRTIQYCTGGDSVKFDNKSIVYQDGTLLYSRNNGEIPLSDTKNSVPFSIKIQEAILVSEKDFKFCVCGTGNIELRINGYCDVSVKGNCKAESEVSFYEDAYVEGVIHEIEFMGNEIEDVLPTSNAYNTFSVGYKKQALSIIANVLEARNYLYLWMERVRSIVYVDASYKRNQLKTIEERNKEKDAIRIAIKEYASKS